MGLEEDLKMDIKAFFKQIESQNQNDRLETLKNLIDKYVHLSTADYVLDYIDLNLIISGAKGKHSEKTFPLFMKNKTTSSKNKIPQDYQGNLCLIESTIGYLSSKGCLSKCPKFNYTTDKF